MIQTQGKKDPVKQEQVLRHQKRQEALAKKPSKQVKNLTKAERDAVIDAMLEWWALQD
ncbi:MAG: hypothetical protein IMZ61_12205 [Planctomycetes bacterium]|nr:hypothetical protein [Planctomycetota bacterium]